MSHASGRVHDTRPRGERARRPSRHGTEAALSKLLARGFKAQAERLASTVRAELGLTALDRLDPWLLAEDRGVTVVPLSQLRAELGGPSDPAAEAASGTVPEAGLDPLPEPAQAAVPDTAPETVPHVDPDADLDAISGLTIVSGSRPLVVVNDRHPRTRQASSLAHELSHLLLDHPARATDGGRRWEPELEQEADWLGGALLVPEEAARVCAIGGWSDRGVAHRFGVSQALARWRLDATGARRVAAHVRSKRRRHLRDAQPAR